MTAHNTHPTRQGGTAYRGRQECHPVDAPLVTKVLRQRGAASVSRPGLQPRQLHADAALAEAGRELVPDHAQGEADQDSCQGCGPRSVYHFPTGEGCFSDGTVPKNPPPRGWAAACPFTAMTAAHPVVSRLPDRTDVCCVGRSEPSKFGVVIGPGFSSPNQPDQVRTTAYHDSSGLVSRSDVYSAIIVGVW